MMVRRQFLALMAAAPVMGKVPVRDAGRVEKVFKTPGPHPNGLQATEEGLWIIDGDDGRVFLVRYEDGKGPARLRDRVRWPQRDHFRRGGDLDSVDLQSGDHPRRRVQRQDDGEVFHAGGGCDLQNAFGSRPNE